MPSRKKGTGNPSGPKKQPERRNDTRRANEPRRSRRIRPLQGEPWPDEIKVTVQSLAIARATKRMTDLLCVVTFVLLAYGIYYRDPNILNAMLKTCQYGLLTIFACAIGRPDRVNNALKSVSGRLRMFYGESIGKKEKFG